MNDKGDDSDDDVSFSVFPQRSKPDCILKGDPGVTSQGNDNCEETIYICLREYSKNKFKVKMSCRKEPSMEHYNVCKMPFHLCLR